MSLQDPYLHFLVWKEQYRDRLQEAELERLLMTARRPAAYGWRCYVYRMIVRAIDRLGKRLFGHSGRRGSTGSENARCCGCANAAVPSRCKV